MLLFCFRILFSFFFFVNSFIDSNLHFCKRPYKCQTSKKKKKKITNRCRLDTWKRVAIDGQEYFASADPPINL